MSDATVVTYHQGDDPEILQASRRARETFRWFWYQVSLDFNRIVPAVEVACVKVPFSDDFSDPQSHVEHMWVEQVNFDGMHVSGTLLNAPNRLHSLKQGDEVHFPLAQLGDWLCVLNGEVYGGHTVQVLRSRMAGAERKEFDRAWGLDFPAPEKTLIPERNETFENAIVALIGDQIDKDPGTITRTFDAGRTLLHLECLYGRAPSVRLLLHRGASVTARCERGWTALDYAKSLDWTTVVTLLTEVA